MRKFSLFLLLATAAVPALAAPGDDDRGRRHRGNDSAEQTENRQQRSEARQQRIESRQQNSESRQQNAGSRQFNRGVDGGEQRAARIERSERLQAAQQDNGERLRARFQQQREQQAQAGQQPSGGNDSNRTWRRGDRDGGAGQTNWRARERQVRTIPDTQPNVTRDGRRGEVARAYEGRRRDYRNGDYTRWSSNRWRDDNRYDWRRYRDHNRSLFRIGIYYDPFGWSYRRWSVGSYLFPSYYGSNYWLNDPWQYRLPPAYGPYRWVRYWDDALLVNIYTGEVVDVINNFFW